MIQRITPESYSSLNTPQPYLLLKESIMKTTTIIVRVLIGLLLLFVSSCFFLKLTPEPVSTDSFKAFQIGLVASTYLLPLAKGVEFLCGLAFVTGKYVTLANIVVLPVTFNILLINYFLKQYIFECN